MTDNEILAARRKHLTPLDQSPAGSIAKLVGDIGTAIFLVGTLGFFAWAVLA